MSTSGLVNQTQIDAAKLIELSVGKCGVPASAVSGEQLERARLALYLLLTSLTNRGLNLWCQKKLLKGIQGGFSRVQMPDEVVDILNASVQQGTYNVATSVDAGTGTALYDAGTPVQVFSAALSLNTAASYTVILYWSTDDIVYTYAGDAQIVNHDPGNTSKWVGVAAESYVVARYWKVVVTPTASGPTNYLSGVKFVTQGSLLPMSQLDRDLFVTMPNQLAQSTNATLQYFFDKQAPRPNLWVWPTTSIDGQLVHLWIQRQIQDVGDLYNTLDIPTRWINSMVYALACEIYLDLPKTIRTEGIYQDLKERSEYWTQRAEAAETDGAPTRFAFNLRGYTR